MAAILEILSRLSRKRLSLWPWAVSWEMDSDLNLVNAHRLERPVESASFSFSFSGLLPTGQ